MSQREQRTSDRWRDVDGTHVPVGVRVEQIETEIYLGGFSSGCAATRARKSSLIVPGGLPVTDRVEGEALIVLYTVVSD